MSCIYRRGEPRRQSESLVSDYDQLALVFRGVFHAVADQFSFEQAVLGLGQDTCTGLVGTKRQSRAANVTHSHW
ncbi:hypothetical protein BQ8794_180031 [Mesorhizobium prunaredense]|uniref:Uncharacterized protein n=1 Tax=Mesorhizobium prunaredense TaxID=1631249 RepID=A0A1R3V490_9HYPH|nr:hypothetical protein BQ8794_180031 [Mesorhizobium prunaredense]